MAAASDYDVIIIGSGAPGGTLAYTLAPKGKRILLLEGGDYARPEKENCGAFNSAVLLLRSANDKLSSRHPWSDRNAK